MNHRAADHLGWWAESMDETLARIEAIPYGETGEKARHFLEWRAARG